MSDDQSPWPERRRTQLLLFAAGALFLLPTALGLADLVDIGDGVVVICVTVAAALLVYGLLGWAGTWVEGDRTEEPSTSATGDTEAVDATGTATGPDGDSAEDEEPVVDEESVEEPGVGEEEESIEEPGVDEEEESVEEPGVDEEPDADEPEP